MKRPALLAIAAATATVLGPAGSAAAVSPEAGETVVRVAFEPKTGNGFEAQLETSEKEVVSLVLERGGQWVRYEVQGKVTETGMKARFGRLGTIDVTFAPTATLSSTEPGPGCSGAPRTLREGTFSGTIEFAGERGFTRLEGPSATGWMSVISKWECPGSEVRLPYAGTSWLSALRPKGRDRDRESASIHVFPGRRCRCGFSAGVHHRHSGGRSIFLGATEERREGMEIVRITQASGPASAFDYDHEAGTATLRAPRPLSGRATLRRGPSGHAIWTSTIRVPLLGADPLRTDGPGVQARLYPEYHFD